MSGESSRPHDPAGMPCLTQAPAPDLTTAWRRRVAADPEAPALIFAGRTWTAADLEAEIGALTAGLRASGIGPGDRVALMLQNVPGAVVTMLAAWRCGAVVPLINPMYHSGELRHLLSNSGARLVVTAPDLLNAVTAVAADTAVETIWLTEEQTTGAGPEDDGIPTLQEITARHAGESPDPLAPPVPDGDRPQDAVALLTYTSGTTGPPKGAMNTHGNILAAGLGTARWMELTPADRVLCVAPIFHITGAVITLLGPLLARAAVVLIGRTTPEGVVRALTEDGVTTTTGSITVFNALARTDGVGPQTFAGVRHLYSGGAPVPPATVTRFRDDFGHYIHNIYGMTETTSACIGVPPGVEAPVDPVSGALAIGRPFPGVTVRVVGLDGAELAPGEPGELEISGPSVVPGYWRNDEATAATFVGGALRTGDGAVLDADGWVYIVDRLKDQINTSGYKVWPREVEDALVTHPAVHEAAVVGVPDDYRGEAVVAYAVLTLGGEVSAEDLRAHARAALAAYKVPRHVEIIAELPKTPTGKIRRRDLRDGTPEQKER